MEKLEIWLADDLESLTFTASGEVLGVIEGPRLLWECSCNWQDGGRSPAQGPCRLHSLERADRISDLFSQGATIWYRGLAVHWDPRRSWPPSMDSFFLVRTLIKSKWPPARCHRLWDVGAGTGFVGLQLAHARPSVSELVAVEPDAAAAGQCQENLGAYTGRLGFAFKVIRSLIQDIPDEDFYGDDAIVANPPYLPTPPWGEDNPVLLSPVWGTGVLSHVIDLALRRRVPLALGYSTICEPEVELALRSTGEVKTRILAERKLPLRLALPRRYLDWLRDERGLLCSPDDVFAFWHTIRVITLGFF